MTMKEYSQVLTNGHTYYFVDEGPRGAAAKGTLVCLHGFPDQWYGWKHQITPWANAGYRVIALHMLGYGSSDKPAEPSAYSTKSLCDDLAQLLDRLELQTVVLVGHDWGGMVAWRFALWHPSRIYKLVAISVPYFPPSQEYRKPSDISPWFGYHEYFADLVSTKEIENRLDVFLSTLFKASSRRPATGDSPQSSQAEETRKKVSILFKGQIQALMTSEENTFEPPPMVISQEELAEYVLDFTKGGMNGPLSYYRTDRIRHEEEKDASLSISTNLPVLFIYGTRDPTCIPAYAEGTASHVENLTVVRLEGIGHWVLLDEPDRVVKEVLAFLNPQSRL